MTDYPLEAFNLHRAAVWLQVNHYEILGMKCIDKPIIQVAAKEGCLEGETEMYGVEIVTKEKEG